MEKYLVDLQFLLDEFVKLEILIAPEASHGETLIPISSARNLTALSQLRSSVVKLNGACL